MVRIFIRNLCRTGTNKRTTHRERSGNTSSSNGKSDTYRTKRSIDISCGTGRHLLEVARRGYTVTGVALSDFILQKAREKCSRNGKLTTEDFMKSGYSGELRGARKAERLC